MINKFKNLFTSTNTNEYDVIISKVNELYKFAPVDFGGGCSLQKALTMAVFIKEFKLKSSADIGVYRGRSLFPQALAHKYYSQGIVYGIDPYDNMAAIQNDRPDIKEELINFADSTNFNQIFEDVSNVINKQGLEGFCELIRKPSSDAKFHFIETNTKLGLVHIDGNHDTAFVIQDVNDYLPLVQDGGIIVLDDVSWESVKPALNLLHTQCEFIGDIIDYQNDFAVFIKKGSQEQQDLAKTLFKSIKNHKYPII